MSAKKQTPLMRQYNQIKEEHPQTILLFRVGDFYETFGSDAELVSRELGITLTKRNNGGDQTPLAGFPFHALDSYLPKLVNKGFKVAICEQTEDPESAKKAGRKIVEREVTEITTPGLSLSEKVLNHNRNNYIFSIYKEGTTLGCAFADISTGEFGALECEDQEIDAILSMFEPSELVIAASQKKWANERFSFLNISLADSWLYEGEYARDQLLSHFNTHSLKGFGVESMELAQRAAGVLLQYIKDNQKRVMGHIRRMYRYEQSDYMSLDSSTKRNLELSSSMHEGKLEGSLISVLDQTITPMGGRLLRRWLTHPLKQLDSIQQRLKRVEILFEQRTVRTDIRESLKKIGDLERLVSRICVGRCSARDIRQLGYSLQVIPELLAHTAELESDTLGQELQSLPDSSEWVDYIDKHIADEPPATIRDGGIIRTGWNPELDELRDIAQNGKKYIAKIKDALTQEVGISTLKIGYNKVFGYYIEVTNAHKDKVPDHFIRKQTLVNAERYITPELKEIEEKILSAEDKSKALEADLFEQVREHIAQFADGIQRIATVISTLDVYQSLAQIAFTNGYVKPELDQGSTLEIIKGRHPVVERSLPVGEPFIPNDIRLDQQDEQIMIITGPNMAGKSIILRQTGLIVLLAQIGSYVPAERARIGLVDKIFTRVGASDNLAAGESTFLVEMNEAANILNNATEHSLILLDEVGRGTSTFDGLSIAWALAEYLHNHVPVAAKTLFATHYHELNALESMYERIINYNVQVREHEGKVVFLRKLVRGGADHSYGIQVANMAGLPKELIQRAQVILEELEGQRLEIQDSSENIAQTKVRKDAGKHLSNKVQPLAETDQMSLFTVATDPVLEELRNKLEAIDPNKLSPMQALLLIDEWKKLLDQ
ncbi:DNA mismatch repair protein MutS [Bacteroidota bacterium]|jgi:DNA mismatch repair protein MutS|nr:DNA mismatch repair protein MutS [Bacteroidota bacterium]MDC3296386.1 DNA mismatch repair protein MutS [Balneolaceae bacterium]